MIHTTNLLRKFSCLVELRKQTISLSKALIEELYLSLLFDLKYPNIILSLRNELCDTYMLFTINADTII